MWRLLYKTKQLGGKRMLTSLSVQLERGVLYGETAGEGKRHILCIPGALGSALTDYGPQLDYFGRSGSGFTVTCFDPIGYGKSRMGLRKFDTRPVHFLKQDAIDVHVGMLKLKIESFSVLGWSDGGIAAMFLASCFPEAVDKLVIWGANAYVTEEDIKAFEATRDISKWSKRMRDPLESIYGQNLGNLWSNWVDSMIDVFNNHKGDLCQEALKLIHSPTLILHGNKDPLVPHIHPIHLHDKIRGSKLYRFPDGKHNIHLRYSSEFNQVVEDFLN